MTKDISFTYEVSPDLDVEVEASIDPGTPQREPDLNQPGAPAEAAEIQTLRVYTDDGTELELDNIFMERRCSVCGTKRFITVLDDIEETVFLMYEKEG